MTEVRKPGGHGKVAPIFMHTSCYPATWKMVWRAQTIQKATKKKLKGERRGGEE